LKLSGGKYTRDLVAVIWGAGGKDDCSGVFVRSEHRPTNAPESAGEVGGATPKGGDLGSTAPKGRPWLPAFL